MKIIDIMPIIITVTALLANIAIGVSTGISFTALMIRCMIVTIVFGIFGYMLTETLKNAVECSNLSKIASEKSGTQSEMEEKINGNESKSTLDIKVPPLDDEEFINIDYGNDDEFVEVNPVKMAEYRTGEHD